MHIRIIREPTINRTTLGVVFIDGRFLSFSLEDAVREIPGQPVQAWKVRGETAIPAGRYRVRFTFSPRFQRRMLELVDVPGFSGIRIHPGNTARDTEGCLLLGVQRADARLVNSTAAVRALEAAVDAADEDVWITIENPPDFAGGQATEAV